MLDRACNKAISSKHDARAFLNQRQVSTSGSGPLIAALFAHAPLLDLLVPFIDTLNHWAVNSRLVVIILIRMANWQQV